MVITFEWFQNNENITVWFFVLTSNSDKDCKKGNECGSYKWPLAGGSWGPKDAGNADDALPSISSKLPERNKLSAGFSNGEYYGPTTDRHKSYEPFAAADTPHALITVDADDAALLLSDQCHILPQQSFYAFKSSSALLSASVVNVAKIFLYTANGTSF